MYRAETLGTAAVCSHLERVRRFVCFSEELGELEKWEMRTREQSFLSKSVFSFSESLKHFVVLFLGR